MIALFVYGTLKNECSNNGILKDLGAEYQYSAETIEKYPMYKSKYNFPYLEKQPGIGNIIQGEVWLLPYDSLVELDEFEGVPDLYIRDSILIEVENIKLECICYFKINNTNLEHRKIINNWSE